MPESRPLRAAKHFASHTGIHSAASISEARSNFRRVLWCCVLLTSLTVYLCQLYGMVIKFMTRPVKTTTSIEYKMPMDFPAVTICNLNPLKTTKLQSKIFQSKEQRKARRRLRKINGDENASETKISRALRHDASINNVTDMTLLRIPVRSINTSQTEENKTTETSVTTLKSNEDTTNETNNDEVEENVLYSSNGDNIKSREVEETSTTRPSSKRNFIREEEEEKALKGLIDIIDSDPASTVEASSWTKRNTTTMRNDALAQRLLIFYMNSIDKKLRNDLTYGLNDLLIDCSFNGHNCLPSDFIRLSNPKYGSCFVFNAGRNISMDRVPIRQVNSSGADVGLELTLFVDQKNYFTDAAPQAGYKVVIHKQTQPPIPEKDGYVVGPGHYTALGVTLSIFERAPRPYGMCKNFTPDENQAINMFLTQLPMTEPTLSSCMKTCEQLEIIKKCRCYSLLHGFADSRAFDAVRDPSSYLPACYIGGEAADFLCLTDVMRQVASGQLACQSDFCKNRECVHTVYQTGSSSAAWPAENAFKRLWSVIRNHPNPNIRKLVNRSEVASDNVKEKLFFESNFLKVKVFFEDLTVVRMKTAASYGIHELLSEIGGQGGLFLGISVITLFELLELLGDMLHICLCSTRIPTVRSVELARC